VSVRWTGDLPPWAFFSLPSRAWQLAAGGLVALGVPGWRRLPRPVAAPAGWAGLALIGLAGVRLDDGTAYPGVAALLPVLGAALVVATGSAQPRGGVASLLALVPLQWMGRISYSWYLWHWPVLLLAPVLVGHGLGPGSRPAAAALSGVLAAVTLVAVENPIRFGRLRRAPGRSLLLGGGLTAVGVCASLVALAAVPPPVGHGAKARTPRLEAAPSAGAPAAEPSQGAPPRSPRRPASRRCRPT
jgi:peptidoglycan/LPS O-acetylase OafA/YrhL